VKVFVIVVLPSARPINLSSRGRRLTIRLYTETVAFEP
jgi:hypothetical protein